MNSIQAGTPGSLTHPPNEKNRAELKARCSSRCSYVSASLAFWWGMFPWTSLPELSRSGMTVRTEVKQVAPPALGVILDSIQLWV